MTASMNARLNDSTWMFLMNSRSIFTMSAGDWDSRPSEEYPVPKSSMANRMPMARSWSNVARSASRSVTK